MATVLVLDEERDWCTLLKRLLEAIGHEVLMCNDPGEALELADAKVLDLAIITLASSDDAAFDVLRRLKNTHPCVRIIIIGDYISDEVAQRSLADVSLVKPAEIETIEREVTELLQQSKGWHRCTESDETPAIG